MITQFRIVLIKPSHYDDNGYVIRWMWSAIPSNSLACLYSLTDAIRTSKRLESSLDIAIDVYDECNQRIPIRKIIRKLKAPGTGGVVCLVGVQSNQFHRALDLARRFRASGLKTMIGGFHVSGSLSMLDTVPEEMTTAMDEGITLVAGEVEDRWGDLLKDALHGRLKPLYNFLDDPPSLEGAAMPTLPAKSVSRYIGSLRTFDAGRGCPFDCSFCTIINVQGKKSRSRTADGVEALIRENYRQGAKRYFITDDDFARNKNWESIFDRIILLRERDHLNISFVIQVDTASYRIPRFIEKAGRAGCRKVFLGLESVNPVNLKASGKKQNRVHEYREMIQAWRKSNAVIYAGYIIGFPDDTYESIMRDVEVLKNELPVDIVEFFVLTPLPGSEDHQRLVKEGAWLEPDLNQYDTEHPCFEHPRMIHEEWMRTYHDAWKSFYTFEHIETIFQRRRAEDHSVGKILGQMVWFCGAMFVEGVHPLQAGVVRRKHRSERRPTLPRQGFISFALMRTQEILAVLSKGTRLAWKLWRISRRIRTSEASRTYSDLAITPVPPTTTPNIHSRIPGKEKAGIS